MRRDDEAISRFWDWGSVLLSFQRLLRFVLRGVGPPGRRLAMTIRRMPPNGYDYPKHREDRVKLLSYRHHSSLTSVSDKRSQG